MNWQETVIQEAQLEDLFAGYLYGPEGWRPPLEGIAKTQAEISFKAGEQEGRKEVATKVEAFLQMHLYARPDKPLATMQFSDWVKLRKLLLEYQRMGDKRHNR